MSKPIKLSFDERVRNLIFLKALYENGNSIIISDKHRRDLKIDDFVGRAIEADMNEMASDSDTELPKKDKKVKEDGQFVH